MLGRTMTESHPATVPSAKEEPLFASFIVDPSKAKQGVWIENAETGDRFLTRRMWCAEHSRAFLEAVQAYDEKHGKGSSDTPDGVRNVMATAIATGLIVDWQPARRSLPYDAAKMAAILADPRYVELRTWILMQASERANFRPDDAAGN